MPRLGALLRSVLGIKKTPLLTRCLSVCLSSVLLFLTCDAINNRISRQVTYDSDGGCYELLTFGSMDGGSSGAGADPNELRRGSCLAAVFLARNRFAVLDKNRQVGVVWCGAGWCGAVSCAS